MTQTKQFSLSKKIYTKIVIIRRLKKTWWLYSLMFVFGLLHMQNFGKDNFSTFLTLFSFGYPVLIFIYLYFWTNSKGHQPIFSNTNLSFDESNIYLERNGNESKLNPDTIQKIITNKDNWMLYISKGQFIYIPKNIFYSNEDYNKFSTLITK